MTSEPTSHRDADATADADVAGESVGGFLESLSARTPAPGGGAVAGLHIAAAAGLLGMVARYTTGPRFADREQQIREIVAATDRWRRTGLDLVAADATAFTAVAEAYRMSRSTDAEADRRRRAIAEATESAVTPPRDVVRAATGLVGIAEELLPLANRSVITDVAAATEAVRAAATTARLNIEVNTASDERLATLAAPALRQVDEIVTRTAGVDGLVREELRRRT